MSIQATLTVSVIFAIVAAGIYAYVGWRLRRRAISASESRLAWQFFTMWWYGLAASTLINGLINLMGAAGVTDLALYVSATFLNFQTSCLALLGLFYYLIYLFTGSNRWLKPLTIFYAFVYLILVYYVLRSEPIDVILEPWGANLVYETPPGGLFIVLLLVLLFASPLFGALLYFSLYFRVPDPTQKFRILLVSWSILIWFLIPFVDVAAVLNGKDWWEIFSRLLGLAAAWTTLVAYWPPAWLKRRYQILSLAEETRQE
jgi:hypothetical protein